MCTSERTRLVIKVLEKHSEFFCLVLGLNLRCFEEERIHYVVFHFIKVCVTAEEL